MCDDFDWHKNIQRLAGVLSPCSSACYYLLQKAAAHPAGNECPGRFPFKVRNPFFFLIRRDQKIFRYRSFQQLPLISVSCKYHPPSMSSYFSAWLRRMFLLAVFSLSLDLFLSQSCVAVYPVEDYMEMSGDCWVNTLPHRGLNGAQQINHLQLDISVLFKWLHSTATLWDRDIDLVC